MVYDHNFLVVVMVTTMIIFCDRFDQVSSKQKHIQSNKQGGRISGSYHRYRYFHQHHDDHYHYHHSPYHYQYDHYHYDDRSGMEEEKELPAWTAITILFFIRFEIRFEQKSVTQIQKCTLYFSSQKNTATFFIIFIFRDLTGILENKRIGQIIFSPTYFKTKMSKKDSDKNTQVAKGSESKIRAKARTFFFSLSSQLSKSPSSPLSLWCSRKPS